MRGRREASGGSSRSSSDSHASSHVASGVAAAVLSSSSPTQQLQQRYALRDSMSSPTAASSVTTVVEQREWGVEMSYSSVLLLSWATLLAAMASRGGCRGETLVILALCAVALRTTHGESRLLMPLLLLSELCLTRAMALPRSAMPFYAASLLSYLTCLPYWTGEKVNGSCSSSRGGRVVAAVCTRLASALRRVCRRTARAQHEQRQQQQQQHSSVMAQTYSAYTTATSNNKGSSGTIVARAQALWQWPQQTSPQHNANVVTATLPVVVVVVVAVVAVVAALAALLSHVWGAAEVLGAVAYVAVGCAVWHHMRHSLTDNETVLVSSLVGFYFADACTNNVLATSAAAAAGHGNAVLVTTTATHLAGRATVLFAALMLLTLSCLANYGRVPTVALSKSSGRRYSQTRMTAAFCTAAVVYGVLLCRVLRRQLGQSAWSWLYAYLATSRFRAWTLLLWFTCIPAVIVIGEHRTSGLRKTVRRKLFHLIAVVAFTPAALVDPPFLAFALTTATSLAIVTETARHFRVCGTDVVTKYTSRYIDDRDSVAGVVRTHIYLIFGLGLPLYMQYRYDTRIDDVRHGTTRTAAAQQQLLELCTNVIPGITALGIVDASAAIIGSSFLLSSRRVLGRYLRNRLFTEHVNVSITHKTTTGTLGGFVCGLLFWAVVLLLQRVPLSVPLLYTFAMVAVCTLTECFIDGVDNLQMPLVALGAVNSLFALLLPVQTLWH